MTFANITREPSDEWIGAGIAETVTADLKNVQGLTVIGRERIFDALRNLQSSDAAQLDDRFAIEIGRGLGARWIVSGGYQRIGDHLRITARFVEVQTGAGPPQREDRRRARRHLQPAGPHRLRADPGPAPRARRLGDRGDREGRDAVGRGLRAVLARDDDPAHGLARRARPRDLAVREGARHRPGVRGGVDGPRRGLSAQGQLPQPAGADREGDRVRAPRPRARSQAGRRAHLARLRPAVARPDRRGDGRAAARRGPRSGPGPPVGHARARLLDRQGRGRRRASTRSSGRSRSTPSSATPTCSSPSSTPSCSSTSGPRPPPNAPSICRSATSPARKACSSSAPTPGSATCTTAAGATRRR